MLTVAVLISGTGSNLRALLEAANDPSYPARIIAVGADRDAAGLAHADAFNIPTFVAQWQGPAHREAWGAELAARLDEYEPDLIVLSGLMKLLPNAVVAKYAPRIINTHPAYLPEFPGAHGVRDALAAGATRTGASIIVVDGGVDSGPIVAQQRVVIEPDDTEDTLHERIKPVERALLIDVVRRIATGELDLTNPPAPAPYPDPA